MLFNILLTYQKSENQNLVLRSGHVEWPSTLVCSNIHSTMWRPGLVSIKKSSTLQSSTLEISPLYLGGEGEVKYWTRIYKAGEWRVLLWRFHHFILGERGEVRTGLESIKLESSTLDGTSLTAHVWSLTRCINGTIKLEWFLNQVF